MISVSEADKIISKNIKAFPAEDVILQDAYGAVLQEDIVADRDLTPFTKSLMDGIAIHFSVWQKGDRELRKRTGHCANPSQTGNEKSSVTHSVNDRSSVNKIANRTHTHTLQKQTYLHAYT